MPHCFLQDNNLLHLISQSSPQFFISSSSPHANPPCDLLSLSNCARNPLPLRILSTTPAKRHVCFSRMVSKRFVSYARKRREKCLKLIKSFFGKNCAMIVQESGAAKQRSQSLTSSISVEDAANHKLWSRWYLVYVLKTVSLVLLYYVFSIGLTFYQKKFIQIFKFPLAIVTGHFMIKFFLAALVRGIWLLASGNKRTCLSCETFVMRIGPAGIAAALDIGLSNWSLVFITISLYTMTKSSAIVFILIFALLLRLEKFKWSLLIVVLLISSGLFLFTFQSTQFHPLGFSLVLGAAVLSGIRWTLSQCLTQRKDFGLSNPIDMIFHVQPWMFITLLPLAIIFEGKTVLEAHVFASEEETLRTMLLIVGGGVAGFFMEVSEYILLTHTSSITLSVSGISKEIFQFILAYRFNGDKISPLNFMGLVICMSGVVVHVVIKILEQNKKLAKLETIMAPEEKDSAIAAALLSTEADDWDGLEEIDLKSLTRSSGHASHG